MTSFETRDGDTIKIGDLVGFKYDYEGHGKVVKISTKRTYIGMETRTTVLVAVGEGHHGYDHYDSDSGENVMLLTPDQIWAI